MALERLIRYYNSAEEMGGWHASSVCVCVFFFFRFEWESFQNRVYSLFSFLRGETRKAITRLRWLKTVSSTFKDLDVDVSL